MRIVRFEKDGITRVGALAESGEVTELPWASLAELFAEADPIAASRTFPADGATRLTPDRILAPAERGTVIIGAGGNYADHAAESKAEVVIRNPVLFPYLPTAVIGPGEAIRIPTPETFTDYEVEFCVVIGKKAKNLTFKNAMDHVLGYTVLNDVSARDIMVEDVHQVMLSKSPDTFLPVGPAIVTADEVSDPYNLRIFTSLNGQIRQDSKTGNMTARIPELLVSFTRYATLNPGDIVSTGTPGGVGYFRTPPESMRPGDVIVAEVEGIGSLSNPVEAGW